MKERHSLSIWVTKLIESPPGAISSHAYPLPGKSIFDNKANIGGDGVKTERQCSDEFTRATVLGTAFVMLGDRVPFCFKLV